MRTPAEVENVIIREDLLYYAWELKRFEQRDLRTTDGFPINILKSGYRNHDSGPDFLHAKIKIGNEIWAGQVEMHVKSSDWLKHQHERDEAFQNVILHVVYENDMPISLPNGEPLPCLEMGIHIHKEIIGTHEVLMQSKAWIPCAKNQRPISALSLRAWYERMLVERLEQKTDQIAGELEKTQNDWEEVFYRLLARNFGFKVNADVFEVLAHSLPRKILIRHKDKLKEIEALLFGQAGLLSSDLKDSYALALKQEYQFLKKKYQLTSLDKHLWKYMRMRPANFPTIRIAQFAILLFKSSHLFSKMMAAQNLKEIEFLFSSEVSGYWKTHYTFDQSSINRSKKLGKSSIHLIIINTIVPFLFHYGQVHQEDKFKQRAFELLEALPAENNRISRGFTDLEFNLTTALDSQALIQLKTNYCDKKRCLSCAVGNAILRSVPNQSL